MSFLKKRVLLVVLSYCFSLSLSAQSIDNPWLISLGVNSIDNRVAKSVRGSLEDYFGFDDNNAQLGFVLGANRYLNKGFSVGLKTSISLIDKEFGLDNADDEEIFFAIGTNLKYDLNELFGETGWFDPFVSLGVNYTDIGDDNNYRVILGYGFCTWFNENLGLVFESDYNHDFDQNSDYFQHSLGFAFRFGGKDTDRDGILDRKDSCPNEAGSIDMNGCPDADGDGIVDADDACPNEAGSIDMNGCPDADGDGIVDADDACPNEAGSIDMNGCPDTDGDGIVDTDDACPNEAGATGNKGCPALTEEVKKTIGDFAKEIYFNSGKKTFKSGVVEKLNGVAEIINSFPFVKFNVIGHTDSVGSASVNKKLSEERVIAVKDYLISRGVDSNRLYTKGYGEERPIASNKTAKGRSKNRRVEIIVVK